MAILYHEDATLDERVAECLEDDFKHKAIETAQNTFYTKRKNLVEAMPEWERLRDSAARIRSHVTENLDFYIKRFVENTQANGNIVHLAPTDEDAIDAILSIAEEVGARKCVKSKSMMTEEIGANDALEAVGVRVVETDCAENIIQVAEDKPSHIVVPALHFDREAIAELYREKKGYTGSSVPEEITHFLRSMLREEFLSADIGMRGCNFAVAETGSLTLVSNEGNGRMVDSIPEVQIAVIGIDRIVPDLASLDVMMSLLVRSSVGAKMTSYFTIDNGPRRESECDGPRETHVILVDNGRSSIIGSDFQPMLRCIRCGACLNACPVYRHITGHGYGSIYPGPMGIVLTPALIGYEKAGQLPYACTLCGACDDVCPTQIPLHDLVLKHRIHEVDEGYVKPLEKGIFTAAGVVLNNSALYGVSTTIGSFGMKALARGKGSLDESSAWLPILNGWIASRDLDNLSITQFRDWFANRRREEEENVRQETRYCTVTKADLEEYHRTHGTTEKGGTR